MNGRTFNKIVEKLNGIHADVRINYITHYGASAKFPILAREQAQDYLISFSSPMTAAAYQEIKTLLNSIKEDNSLELIWENIKEQCEIALWDEFHHAYGNDSQHPQFRILIANGGCVTAPDLWVIEAKLMATRGYQDWCYEQERCSLSQQQFLLRFERHCLWTNKDSTRENQEAFDRQYGIVPYLP